MEVTIIEIFNYGFLLNRNEGSSNGAILLLDKINELKTENHKLTEPLQQMEATIMDIINDWQIFLIRLLRLISSFKK